MTERPQGATDRPPPRTWRVVVFFLGVALVLAVVVFGVLVVLDAVMPPGPEDELFGSRFWVLLAVQVVVASAIGGALGLALRRRYGWTREALPRYTALSRRQRLRLNWDLQRARAPRDPVLAAAAVERLELGVEAVPDQRRLTAKASRVAAWISALSAAGIAVVMAVFGFQGDPGSFWVALGFVVLGLGAALLPRLSRGAFARGERRLVRTLEASRVAAAGRDPDGVT